MMELHIVPRWFLLWFRGLPRALQWPVGLVIVAGCAIATWVSIAKQGRSGEPQQAFFVALLLFVASVVLSELIRPKPNIENAKPSGLGDFQFPTTTEDRPVPLLWGRVRIKGPNIIWNGDLEQDAITEKVKTGLWSSTRVTTGFQYNLGLQFSLCRGSDDAPVTMIKFQVGEEDAFVGSVSSGGRFDVDDLDILGGEDFGAGGMQATCDFYGGTTTQVVNAYLNDNDRQRIATAITPTAPRYTGNCHVVMREFTSVAPTAADRGAYIGNSTSLKPYTFEVERFPAIFSGQSAGENKIGSFDANPINVAFDFLTNVEWGFGAAVSTIDVGASSTFKFASDSMIAEGNGFAMLLDRTMPIDDLKAEIERQIDGLIFFDQSTRLWKIQLIRGPDDTNFGYDIDTVQQFTDAEIKKVTEFTRSSWEDTTNEVQVKFAKRDDDYKQSFALAQDMGNAILTAGGSFLDPTSNPGIISFPGVKLSALASNLASRELRGQSFPLARATFVTNRVFFDLIIGGVFAWTNTRLGFVGPTKLAMRVTRITYGKLQQNAMTIQATQDVFAFAAAIMGTPPATGWVPPVATLVAYPAAQQTAFEAPRGLIVRDPAFSGDDQIAKVWCGARRQGGEVAFEIRQRNSSGAPSGSFSVAGDVIVFLRIGQLDSNLDPGTAIPTASILVNSTPDTQTIIEGLFDDAATTTDLGVDLVQLIKINDEFMLVSSASVSGADVDLETVFRGVLGSSQQFHLTNDDVFLIFVGGGLTDTTFPVTNNVDIELRSRTSASTFAGAVTTFNLTMDKRALRPYPPQAIFYNGSGTRFNTPDLEADGAGLNGVGFDVDWHRRAFDTGNEVLALLTDNPAVAASTEFRVTVFSDPLGANDQVFQSAWVTGTGPITPTQAEIINQAAAGTLLRVRIQVRHDIAAETDLLGRVSQTHDVTPTSTRTSQFYLGGDLRGTDNSNTFIVASATIHNITIGASYTVSVVQENINGGGFVTVIATGLTTGVLNGGAALAVSDTVVIRHTANQTPDPNFVEIDDGTSPVAYGAFSA